MADRSFLDTNVLVYTDDGDAPDKKVKALDLYERLAREQSGVVSTQVLQEYFVASTRKLGVDPELARRKVQLFGGLGVVVLDRPHILAAIDLVRLQSICSMTRVRGLRSCRSTTQTGWTKFAWPFAMATFDALRTSHSTCTV